MGICKILEKNCILKLTTVIVLHLKLFIKKQKQTKTMFLRTHSIQKSLKTIFQLSIYL